MPKRKPPPWTSQEIAILHDIFPREGINGAADALPDRSWQAINVMASRYGLRSGLVGDAPKPRLQGAELEEAIRLREESGWSFARIGATFGVAELSACNAVLIALCPRKGFTPAERNPNGRLTEQGLERIRLALRKGMKGVDIQLRLGVSASTVAKQRREYEAELKERRLAPLPPPGGGIAYSGVKLSRAKKIEVEQLFMTGLGTLKVSQQSGASKTSCTRIRNRLIKKLKRKGECLPGCDSNGVRHVQKDSSRHITEELRQALISKLMERVPVRRAALELCIGGSSAYKIRNQLKADLAAEGKSLPAPILPGRVKGATHPARQAQWLPAGAKNIYRYRALCKQMPSADAKAKILAEMADAERAENEAKQAEVVARRAERDRPRTFEEQLARVARGEVSICNKIVMTRRAPDMTLGGVTGEII